MLGFIYQINQTKLTAQKRVQVASELAEVKEGITAFACSDADDCQKMKKLIWSIVSYRCRRRRL